VSGLANYPDGPVQTASVTSMLHAPSWIPSFDPDSREIFRQQYNRGSFLFQHGLREHPLFALPNLLELARRQTQNAQSAYWSNDNVAVRDSWSVGEEHRYSLADTIAGIETNSSLVILKHVENDCVFGPFVHKIQDAVLDLAGPQMRDDATARRGTVVIASPGRITSYHIDSDVNYLFQIHGDKLFSVFDQIDSAVTSHEELERYYLGDANGAIFKPERQREAHTYQLRAGCGVHVPCMTAHWAQNLDAPSIALSINFDLRSVTSLGRIYRLNGRLRRYGLHPKPPGISHWRDGLKTAVLGVIEVAQHLR
jgi:hypothetical protein